MENKKEVITYMFFLSLEQRRDGYPEIKLALVFTNH